MDNSVIPQEQYDRVLSYGCCDIDYEFLGFTDVYEHLAAIIPRYWTIVDLGCAYAPQAFIFRNHKAYHGVDCGGAERFRAPNTTHHDLTIQQFIARHLGDFAQNTTFAICSYVPDSGAAQLARESFRNVFNYYPAPDPDEPHPFWRASLARPEAKK